MEQPHQLLSINENIIESLSFLERELFTKQMDVTLDLAPDLPSAMGDAVELQQVLINLVLNAEQAMENQEEDRRLTIRSFQDEKQLIRVSLQRFLSSYGYVTETYASAREFLNRPTPEGTACLILDLQMPNMSGLELQQQIADSYRHVPVVFLTAQGDIPTSVKAMKLGAEDFLPKMSDEKELLDAVERALSRSKHTIDLDKTAEHARQAAASLTAREKEVCQCVISGMLNKQIAIKLDVAERTVKAHRAKVMEKFGVISVPDLVRISEKAGISEV